MKHRIFLCLILILLLPVVAQADDIKIEGTTDIEDTRLIEAAATTNYGSEEKLSVSSYTGSGHRTVMRFDISAIPGGSSISDAQLYLYFHAKYNTDAMEITSHACSQDAWVEMEATWNIYSTGNNWGTAGGDFAEAYSDLETLTNSYDWYSWDVTSIISADLVSGESNIFLVALSAQGSVGYKTFHSTEYASLQPYLDITYTTDGEPAEKKARRRPIIIKGD